MGCFRTVRFHPQFPATHLVPYKVNEAYFIVPGEFRAPEFFRRSLENVITDVGYEIHVF